MALKYTNRIGEEYYFKAVPTKKGKFRYYTTKIEDDCQNINIIPYGFEIYETPEESIVAIRKTVKKLFSNKEISIIEDAIKETTNIVYFLIDVRENILTIYIGNRNGMNIDEYDEKYRDLMIKTQAYSPRMKFIKKEEKNFIVQRRCYLGSMPDWIDIDKSDDLKELSSKYCYHLDKESFMELGFE